jgi:uncharacterized protein (TIGR03435 family)
LRISRGINETAPQIVWLSEGNPKMVRMMLCCAVLSFGQSTPAAFEVASIRTHQGPLMRIADFKASGPRLSLEGYNTALLILEAYGVKNYQMSFASPNLPIDEPYYDISAKAEGDGSPTRDEFRGMLRTLLADRFKLKIHREMREIPVYELVVDKNGPALKPGTGDGECAVRLGPVQPEDRNYRYQFTNCTLEPFASAIGGYVSAGLPVLDRTGLTGRYDITMFATPDFKMRNSSDPGDISVADAIRKLGLKMEAKKDSIEVIVVDHVEKASGN